VHQTVILATLFYILPMQAGVAAKYIMVLALTVGVSLIFYVLAERLPWPLRALVGLPEQPAGARDLSKASQPARF
jgi:glucan biosynthesis protein C